LLYVPIPVFDLLQFADANAQVMVWAVTVGVNVTTHPLACAVPVIVITPAAIVGAAMYFDATKT
jgi:hypothetical protein